MTKKKANSKKNATPVTPVAGTGMMLWLSKDSKAGVIQITTGDEDTQDPVAQVAMYPENLEKLAGQLLQLVAHIKRVATETPPEEASDD